MRLERTATDAVGLEANLRECGLLIIEGETIRPGGIEVGVLTDRRAIFLLQEIGSG